MAKKQVVYDEKAIKTLDALEHIRLRTGMYIGRLGDGSVLAMVSKPAFDPNPFVHGISREDYRAVLGAPNRPLFNRAILGGYEPGSESTGRSSEVHLAQPPLRTPALSKPNARSIVRQKSITRST